MASANGDHLSVVVKWAGKEYPIDNLKPAATVLDLKSAIHVKTNVLPARQKLLNLRLKGTWPMSSIHLGSLKISKIQMCTFKKS